jgi:osmotically-inducible protein OsmY
MSANDDLATSVAEELFWNPIVGDAPIAISADDGRITLRGTVGTLREKRAAEEAARRVFGVVSVESRLQVKRMDDEQRADAELRGDVLQALMLDGLVPQTVDAQVEDGLVTLSGSAEWQYQRDEATRVASTVVGALQVSDHIELERPQQKRAARDAGVRADREKAESERNTR